MAEKGLLSFFATPEGQGLLAAGFGGLAGARRGQPLNSIGRGGLAGLAGYANAQDQQAQEAQRLEMGKDREQNRALRQMQMDQQTAQLAKQKGQEQWQAGLPAIYKQATETTYGAGDEGPTMTRPNPSALRDYAMQPNSPFADEVMKAQLFPKADDYKVVGGSLVQVGQGGVKPVYTAPEKPEAAPTNVREYEYARGQGYGGTFEQFQLAQRKAGASSVSVNTGQKGFDNTLKLRGDFRSEPIYKAHQEMTSAYGQIQQSLGQASPAGDLAGATKIMKLLDPGSVVRESELGMAMAASGALDRLQHYATNVVNGTKLTPNQRKDFQTLADALYSESVKQYNGKRGEYQGIAERNGLSVPDVLGSEGRSPKPTKSVKRTGMMNGRRVVEYSDGSMDYAD